MATNLILVSLKLDNFTVLEFQFASSVFCLRNLEIAFDNSTEFYFDNFINCQNLKQLKIFISDDEDIRALTRNLKIFKLNSTFV